jgi:hypothetical protein
MEVGGQLQVLAAFLKLYQKMNGREHMGEKR